MIRFGGKVDKVWYRDLLKGSGEIGAYVAGIFLENFDELLKDAPQRYGSHVASFRIAVDGACDPPTEMDYRRRENWFYKGSEEAIQVAIQHAQGVREAAMMASSGMTPASLALVNEIEHAEYAEEQEGRAPGTGSAGDPGNPMTAGHIQRFIDKIYPLLQARVYVGKSTWNHYVMFDL